MSEARPLNWRDLFGLMSEEFRRNWALAAASVAVIVLADEVLQRVIGPDEDFIPWLLYAIPSIILTIILQLTVTWRALTMGELSTDVGVSRLGLYLCVAIATSIMTVLGFLLLIIPGVWLMARWMLAGPIVLGETMGFGESMSESWARTRPIAWPLFWALFLLYVVGFGILLLPYFLIDEETISALWQVVGSALGYLISFLACLMAVGAYRHLLQTGAVGGTRSPQQ